MATHTADCADCDFRLARMPAKDWPAGSMRPLYLYRDQYPSTLTSIRGSTWKPENLEGSEEQKVAWGTEHEITGYIPQVGRYNSRYGGFMNSEYGHRIVCSLTAKYV